MTDKPRITKVYRFANDMVIVFDQHGQQMPDHQGPYAEVIDGIRAAGFHDIRDGEMIPFYQGKLIR